MALRSTPPATNGDGRRKCRSWIASFVEFTDNLEAPEIFRKWAAISAIAAMMEQKTWLKTSSPLYPNLYTFLIGHPGVGKTRTIKAAYHYVMETPDPHLAYTSMTMASLTDLLMEAKRFLDDLPNPPISYNSMYIMADELSAFMHSWDHELIGGLTTFYDVEALPFGQARRLKDLRIKIQRPQLNIITGSTPSNLVRLLPEEAWDQGFCSRVILVFSNERPAGDDFAYSQRELSKDMVHDIRCIAALRGGFEATEGYQAAVRAWRNAGEVPKPSHPRLEHYNARRKAHLYKLSMVASADRGDGMILTAEDWNIAMQWLEEAEMYMPGIFKHGASTTDSRAMDEIADHIRTFNENKGMSESRVFRFATERVPAHMVNNMIDIMVRSGRIQVLARDKKTGQRTFIAVQGAAPAPALPTPESSPIKPHGGDRRI